MAKLPETQLKVEGLIENKITIVEPRPYLGISTIGESCPRKLWYNFRWVSKPEELTERKKRLFNRGHREEAIIIKDLESIGCKIHSTQVEVVTGWGHIKGHNDGIGENIPDAPKTPHLLEFKTYADKYFKKLIQNGVEINDPKYYAQCQCYMKLLKLKRTLFIAVNKDNDQRHYERLRYNAQDAKSYLDRAEDIITSQVAPKRINESSSWWQCKWCNNYDVCHFGEMPEKNCRTCQACDMYEEGAWGCSMHGCYLSTEEQREGCTSWILWEGLK